MLQDYHLYLCAGFIQNSGHTRTCSCSSTFHGPIPTTGAFCPPKCAAPSAKAPWATISSASRRRITACLSRTRQAYVPGAVVDYENSRILWDGRQIQVRAYPISIDSEEVRRLARTKEARSHDRYLPNHWNEFTLLRVDRAEPSKNIVRGFQAFDRFLESHREFQGRVNFVAITVPSRMDVVEYQDYLDHVSAVVGRINAKYANVETGWQPIHLIMGKTTRARWRP